MTKRKNRNVQPYTCNAAAAGLGGFEEPLKNKVLRNFFDEEEWARVSQCIHDAVTQYNLDLQTNPARKIRLRQRQDQHELIECMKELNIRLNPLYIPLWEAVKSAYLPYSGETLGEQIRDLLRRLSYLQKLFEATPFPLPNRTNPGKPERDKLVRKLGTIFDKFTRDDYLLDKDGISPMELQKGKIRDRKEFVKLVFEVFYLKPPRL